MKPDHATLIDEGENYQLYKLNDYFRTVYCIESDTIGSARNIFENLYAKWQDQSKEKGNEPMMNIVCSFEDNIWYTYIFPRKAFRPWQYTAEGDDRLMVSPATVELSGIFITPIESHFERITKQDVINILEQCS